MNEIIIKDTYRALVSMCDLEKTKKYNWCLSSHGYVYCKKEKSNIYLHRFIMDAKEDEIVDHASRNKLDNRRDNLRFCTKSQNSMNKKLSSTNKSGFTGVFYRDDRSKWVASIKLNRKKIFLGSFKNKEDAIKARQEAEIKYFGKFAPTNTEGEGE